MPRHHASPVPMLQADDGGIRVRRVIATLLGARNEGVFRCFEPDADERYSHVGCDLFDGLPVDDLGLVRGIEKNYRNGESVSRTEARQIGESWRPWRTVATWYLWRSLEPGTAEI